MSYYNFWKQLGKPKIDESSIRQMDYGDIAYIMLDEKFENDIAEFEKEEVEEFLDYWHEMEYGNNRETVKSYYPWLQSSIRNLMRRRAEKDEAFQYILPD